MKNNFKNISSKSRRGISNIIGSILVLALVASIGSVILFQGLNQINAFSYDLSNFDNTKNLALQEDLLFENIRFDPNTNHLLLHIGNIGTTETTITSITAVKIDTQELILDWDEVNSTVQIEDYVFLNQTANLSQTPFIWAT